VLIWGNNRYKFSSSPGLLTRKAVCVSCLISEYRGVPEMIVSDPMQIETIEP
jgi:hypothetical protein